MPASLEAAYVTTHQHMGKYVPKRPHGFALQTMIRTAPDGYELWLETTTKNVAAALWYTGRKGTINRFVGFSPAAKEVVHLVRVTLRGEPREKNLHRGNKETGKKKRRGAT